MNKVLIAFAVTLVIAWFGCTKYAPAPEAFFIQPSYVNVAVTTPSIQGSASHKITDLFLYVDGKFQGVYPCTGKLPIVTKGKNVNIDLFAGIKNNGISETLITWLLYDKIEFDTLAPSGTTLNRGITFKYNPNVKFMWVEDFDGFGVSLIKSSITAASTSLNLISSGDSFEGKSAMFELTSGIPVAKFESSIFYNIPRANANVYLELNYKCDLELEVGVTDGVKEKSCITVNPKSEWNKIYIQLADAVNREPLSDQYKIYFKANNPNQLNNARVWLDNIKMIYL